MSLRNKCHHQKIINSDIVGGLLSSTEILITYHFNKTPYFGHYKQKVIEFYLYSSTLLKVTTNTNVQKNEHTSKFV